MTAYSLEKLLESKKFFLEEGTFNFWNPTTPDDTVLGRVLEIADGWSVGYVSPSLIGKYRTFDSYDDYLLSFLCDTAPEKYRCVFVFDPYVKTFSVYDADEERPKLPIYLDFDNLVEELEVTELSDELVTAMRPYGSDSLDIRNVNPIGTNWLYNLDYFIENGDLSPALSEKWRAWEADIAAQRDYYRGLVGLQASVTSLIAAAQAELTDLNGELENLVNQQSITIQALAEEITEQGKQQQQEQLDEINEKIEQKKAEIAAQEAEIDELQDQIDAENPASYTAQIAAVVGELGLSSYFTAEEQAVLRQFFIEQDLTEETFVASSSSGSGSTSDSVSDAPVQIAESTITKIDLSEQFSKNMYVLAGGKLTVGSDPALQADIVRGTLETQENGEFVLSAYTGTLSAGDTTAQSGMVTLSGTLTGLQDDVTEVDEDGVKTLEGSTIGFTAGAASLFVTQNASEYQQYSVQMELLEYAEDVLRDAATPTYEFSVTSGNFIFAQEFEPFRSSLKLGDAVYLRLQNGDIITPVLIEIELDFEDQEELSLTFSNRFKRHDSVNTLKSMIETSYSTSRNFDASKYVYNQTVGTASKVTAFMNGSLDAAVNTIYGAANQSVRIDGAGIHVGGDSACQLRIVNSMIALTDDNWQTAKVGIGLFAAPDIGEYFGVNAEVIGGKLIVGNSLVIENTNDAGIMQFKVDASGAWLYNSTFVMAKDSGGKLLLDPDYGFVAGTGDLYTVDGTTVRPSFIDEDGDVILDEDGLPENANFYIDPRTGNAYFRGKVYATDGVFNGTVYATDGEFTGTVHATDGEFTGTVHATDGEFTGAIHATSGEFSGTIKAAVLSGTITGDTETGGAITGVSLDIGNGAFTVDTAGNVVIKNGSISWGAVTGTDEIDNRIDAAQDAADSAQSSANSAQSTANSAQSSANTAYDNIRKLANGTYSGGTFIDGTSVTAPYISGGEIRGTEIYGGAYHPLSGVSTLELSASWPQANINYPDLVYSGGSGSSKWEAFRVRTYPTASELILHGHPILIANNNSVTWVETPTAMFG